MRGLPERARQVIGAKFRRQHPIGRYIADFCCPERKFVLELDGSQHAAQEDADHRRTAFLIQRGYRVLRFWDNDVLTNTDLVVQEIGEAVTAPHPSPLPAEERGGGSAERRTPPKAGRTTLRDKA